MNDFFCKCLTGLTKCSKTCNQCPAEDESESNTDTLPTNGWTPPQRPQPAPVPAGPAPKW